MERVLWPIKCIKSGLQSCMLEISSWMMLHSQVDQFVGSDPIDTLIEENQCYTMQEASDIPKISKSIKLLVKMKNVFYFMEKT